MVQSIKYQQKITPDLHYFLQIETISLKLTKTNLHCVWLIWYFLVKDMHKEKTASNPRLLILSCSQRKQSTQGLLPALQRYDGPAYRVMSKFMRVHPSEVRSLDVYILSAEFGLISADKPIPDYDRRMTYKRAKELQQPALSALKHILICKQYKDLFINLGKDYLRVLNGYESLIPANLKVIVSRGVMGRKLAELRNWLHERVPESLDSQMKVIQQGKAYLRGIKIALTPQQIMEIARIALAEERNIPKYQIWYMQVGDQRVPVKWLVSQLTGLPVNAFHTNEAKRILQQLGIKIRSRW